MQGIQLSDFMFDPKQFDECMQTEDAFQKKAANIFREESWRLLDKVDDISQDQLQALAQNALKEYNEQSGYSGLELNSVIRITSRVVATQYLITLYSGKNVREALDEVVKRDEKLAYWRTQSSLTEGIVEGAYEDADGATAIKPAVDKLASKLSPIAKPLLEQQFNSWTNIIGRFFWG